MAKKKDLGQRFRWEFIAGMLGVASVPFFVSLALVFFPNVVWSLPAWEIGVILGFILTPWAFGIWGLVLGFRYHTDKIIWNNRVVECSNPKKVELGVEAYPLPDGVDTNDPSLDPARREQLVASGAILPWTGEKGQTVPRCALAIGGFWWGGFAIHPGVDGYILFFGEEWIDLHGNTLIPRDLILIHHSEVDQEIIRNLEAATVENGSGRFIPYSTPLYVCGDLDPKVLEYMCNSPEIREGVLARIGIPGAARAFAGWVLRELGPDRAKEIGLSMNGWQALQDTAREYLVAAGLYSEAARKGIQTVGALRADNRRLQREITGLEAERQKNAATIQMYVDLVYGDARGAQRYRGGYASEQPTPPGIGPDRTRPGYDRIIEQAR